MTHEFPPLDHLAKAPFHLDAASLEWVKNTYSSLQSDLDVKLAQLFIIGLHGPAHLWADEIKRLRPGGVTRFFASSAQEEMTLLDTLQDQADIPMFVSADLEGSRMSFTFGAQVPNPLALAAVDDTDLTRRVYGVLADEAVAVGANWSFTPVVDINAAFRSAIVATRGFGSDPDRIARHAMTQVDVLQEKGIAACLKHWPGEGYDDRDQHLVTTVNPLSVEDWNATFGRLYRDGIDRGVLSVMSAHIALPAYVRAVKPDATLEEAYCPASLSPILTQKLLREELGFNGLIISDASEMAGATSVMEARDAKVQMLRAGCDIVLFTGDMRADIEAIKAALADGTLSHDRINDALIRVLGLKATLKLHRAERKPITERLKSLATPASLAIADEAFARAPTLVKDVNDLFPITPESHKRVLILTTGIASPIHPQPIPLALPEMMRERGFDVTVYEKGTPYAPETFDLVLYVMAEETLLTRSHIFLDWARLMGDFRFSMKRSWPATPTALVSFGFPYYLYDAPRMPAVINAYCTSDEMQKAALDCMMGDRPFNPISPVDPFCGQEDAVL